MSDQTPDMDLLQKARTHIANTLTARTFDSELQMVHTLQCGYPFKDESDPATFAWAAALAETGHKYNINTLADAAWALTRLRREVARYGRPSESRPPAVRPAAAAAAETTEPPPPTKNPDGTLDTKRVGQQVDEHGQQGAKPQTDERPKQ